MDFKFGLDFDLDIIGFSCSLWALSNQQILVFNKRCTLRVKHSETFFGELLKFVAQFHVKIVEMSTATFTLLLFKPCHIYTKKL